MCYYKKQTYTVAVPQCIKKTIHINTKLNVFPRFVSVHQNVRVVLTLWRSRSSWGNCSGDNPHQIVSKTGLISPHSSLFGERKGSSLCLIVRKTIPFFLFLNYWEERGRSHSQTQKKMFNFPLGVQSGSWTFQV